MASRAAIETIGSADPPCHGGTIRAASAFEVPRRTGAERPGGPSPDRVQPRSPNTQGSLSTTRNLGSNVPSINDGRIPVRGLLRVCSRGREGWLPTTRTSAYLARAEFHGH
jgi:hypothetical protein